MIFTGGQRIYDLELVPWQEVVEPGSGIRPSQLARIISVLISQRGMESGPILIVKFIYFRQTTYLTFSQSWLGGRRRVNLPKEAEEWPSFWVPLYGNAQLLGGISSRGAISCVVRSYPSVDERRSYMLPQCARQTKREAAECVRKGLQKLKPSSPVPAWYLRLNLPVYVIEDRMSQNGVLYDAGLAAAKDSFPNEALLAELM